MLLADTNMSLVFRIHGPSGRVRVEVPPNCSLKQLYKIVAEKCQFETAGSFVLYMESNYRKVRFKSIVGKFRYDYFQLGSIKKYTFASLFHICIASCFSMFVIHHPFWLPVLNQD